MNDTQDSLSSLENPFLKIWNYFKIRDLLKRKSSTSLAYVAAVGEILTRTLTLALAIVLTPEMLAQIFNEGWQLPLQQGVGNYSYAR